MNPINKAPATVWAIAVSANRGVLTLLLCLAGMGAVSAAETSKIAAAAASIDRLRPSSPGTVKIDGYLGARIQQCIENRIMVQETESLLELFRTRTKDVANYKGEFIGKWLAAAALGCRYQPIPALQEKMGKTVDALIQSRSADGYISTYETKDEFKVWDVWIQKYVLLGLIAQYDRSDRAAVLDAARKSADHLINLNGPGKLSIEEYGPAVHKGGVNYSILEPIVLLYERTREKKYLDFAEYIVASWSRPSKYTSNGVRLLENAEAGVPAVEGAVLHSYVLMSCFEGVCELYRATGEKRYLDGAIKFARGLMRDELMITGSVSNHEMWYRGTLEQTEMLEKPVETCATATWMKLCYQLLRLTGDSRWADQMEISLYNALLGAMMPQGEWWSYDSPLMGERLPCRVQGVNLSCCVSSGPRGLLITPEWATMTNAVGETFINLYSSGTASFPLPKGGEARITQETGYPVTNPITLTVQLTAPTSFALNLRIPEWSKHTVLKLNGESHACQPGTYARLDRQWQPNDKVTIEMDLRGRIIRAPSGAPQQAVMRGPVVLAFDNRLVPEEIATVWLLAEPLPFEGPKDKPYVLPEHNLPPTGQQGYLELRPVASIDKDVFMAYEVPFFVRTAHFQGHRPKKIVMCDYASAGNKWSEDNIYRVWAPQPMFMGSLYARNTWKIMSFNAKQRTTVPKYIQQALKK